MKKNLYMMYAIALLQGMVGLLISAAVFSVWIQDNYALAGFHCHVV